MIFKKETLKAILWEDHDGEYKIIRNQLEETSRWSLHYSMIFEFEGNLYESCYSRGATESQDEMPYEYADDEIECPQVWPVEKVVIDYVYEKPD